MQWWHYALIVVGYLLSIVVSYLFGRHCTKVYNGKWTCRDRLEIFGMSMLGPIAFIAMVVVCVVAIGKSCGNKESSDKPAKW